MYNVLSSNDESLVKSASKAGGISPFRPSISLIVSDVIVNLVPSVVNKFGGGYVMRVCRMNSEWASMNADTARRNRVAFLGLIKYIQVVDNTIVIAMNRSSEGLSSGMA